MRLGAHVLVEKPIAGNEVEAEELLRIAGATGRLLQVGHIERFNPILRQLEDRLDRPASLKPIDFRHSPIVVSISEWCSTS